MTTAARPPFLSYSANHEDVLLNRVFGMQADGFYVDVGAAHPLFENDTRALYDRGWRGINIEPTAAFFRELTAQRPRDLNLNIAISDEPGELSFHEIVGTGLSTADAVYADEAAAKGFEVLRYTVPARTLRSVLEEANVSEIDVLKVDVEGLELRVMQSNDWAKFRPRIILAEGTYPESPVRRDDGVADYLAEQGYRHVYFDGLNDFYVERDFAFPPGAFDHPLNVFDRFTPFPESQLANANQALTSELDHVRRARAHVEGELAAEVASLKREREDAKIYIDSLTTQLRRIEAVAKAQTIDLSRAHAETIAMRDRGEALAAELEATVMSSLRAERYTQDLVAMKSQLVTQLATQLEVQSINFLNTSQRLESVYASNSWRITRPLRALARPRRTLRFVLARLHLL